MPLPVRPRKPTESPVGIVLALSLLLFFYLVNNYSMASPNQTPTVCSLPYFSRLSKCQLTGSANYDKVEENLNSSPTFTTARKENPHQDQAKKAKGPEEVLSPQEFVKKGLQFGSRIANLKALSRSARDAAHTFVPGASDMRGVLGELRRTKAIRQQMEDLRTEYKRLERKVTKGLLKHSSQLDSLVDSASAHSKTAAYRLVNGVIPRTLASLWPASTTLIEANIRGVFSALAEEILKSSERVSNSTDVLIEDIEDLEEIFNILAHPKGSLLEGRDMQKLREGSYWVKQLGSYRSHLNLIGLRGSELEIKTEALAHYFAHVSQVHSLVELSRQKLESLEDGLEEFKDGLEGNHTLIGDGDYAKVLNTYVENIKSVIETLQGAIWNTGEKVNWT